MTRPDDARRRFMAHPATENADSALRDITVVAAAIAFLLLVYWLSTTVAVLR